MNIGIYHCIKNVGHFYFYDNFTKCTPNFSSGVTRGGEGAILPRAQQTRGRKIASPKYFKDHTSEFDEVY